MSHCINTFALFSQASTNSIEEFGLEFIDDSQASTFRLSLPLPWLHHLTNLNLTGVHCHSTDFQHAFHSLHLLRSLSLTPCLLLYIDPFECHCTTSPTSPPYQIHQLSRRLRSLNLVSHLVDLKQSCSILLDQYHLHLIRHSSVHQNLPNKASACRYESIVRWSIRSILETLDLHHLSIRIPNYALDIDDLALRTDNHLQTLVLDVRVPLTFHTKLTGLYAMNHFAHLRRFILISDHDFQLTELLLDKFRSLELVEILTIRSHLKRSTIKYLERVLTPSNYPHLNLFRLSIGSVDAQHLLKHLVKTIRSAFEHHRPAFQFDLALARSTIPRSILSDYSHEVHRLFHSLPSTRSQQLSMTYPRHLNFKSLYSDERFHQ